MGRRRNRYKTKRNRYGGGSGNGLQFWKKESHISEVALWALEIVLAIVLAAMVVYCFGTRVTVVGQSMAGTLQNGEQVLMNRIVYKLIEPKANDLIIFLPNGNENSHYYIKRVIAVPGDTVQIMDGKVYVNGEPFQEVIENSYIENGLLAEEPVTVEEGEYFVLGDNRGNSEDSRYANIGNVQEEYILGKAWFIVSPFERIGFIK